MTVIICQLIIAQFQCNEWLQVLFIGHFGVSGAAQLERARVEWMEKDAEMTATVANIYLQVDYKGMVDLC
jgi:hypothetical protein